MQKEAEEEDDSEEDEEEDDGEVEVVADALRLLGLSEEEAVGARIEVLYLEDKAKKGNAGRQRKFQTKQKAVALQEKVH